MTLPEPLAAREARVRQSTGLHQLGLTDAQLEEPGLQPLVIEQRDLHRIVDRQRLGQQLGHAGVDAVLVSCRPGPADFLAEPLASGLLHRAEAAVRADAGAAGQHQHGNHRPG